MSFWIVKEWTSSGKTFKVGDVVTHIHMKDSKHAHSTHASFSKNCCVITSIEVCNAGDGHVIIDDNPNTLTDFCYMELDKSHYREEKLKEIGI